MNFSGLMGNWSGAKSAAVTMTQRQIAHLYRGYLHSSGFTPSSHITPLPPPPPASPAYCVQDAATPTGKPFWQPSDGWERVLYLAERRVTLSHVFWCVVTLQRDSCRTPSGHVTRIPSSTSRQKKQTGREGWCSKSVWQVIHLWKGSYI